MGKKVVKSDSLKSRLLKIIKKNKQLIKFFVIFITVISLYYLAVGVFNNMFDGYINFTAWISAKFFGIFGIAAKVQANVIITQRSILSLSFGCEGTEPIIIFLAGVLAFPIGIKPKIIGLASGIITLYCLNIIRILGLYYVTIKLPYMFESFHVVIFPIIFIILSILTFILWMRISIKYRKKNPVV